MNKFLIDPILLDHYISYILETFFEKSVDRDDKYILKCNICERKNNRKTAAILKNRDPWMFNCLRCGESMPVEIWMKKFFPTQYDGYLKDLFKRSVNNRKTIKYNIQPIIIEDDSNNTKYFIPINQNYGDGKLNNLARIFCERRYIPETVWKRWYIATNGKYKDRIVIPFFNSENKIYTYQCRTLVNNEVKYLGPKTVIEPIYNIYNVDINNPVTILEGPIDSEFVENSIGLTGTGKSDSESIKNVLLKYWLMDNDKPGKEKSKELLLKGECVFLWKKFLKQRQINDNIKDINDYIIYCKGRPIISFTELQPFFTRSIFDSIYL
jgi:hypothetical protein